MIVFLGLLILTVLVLITKTNKTILCNEVFWLLLFWTFIIGICLTDGVTWKYSISFRSVLFIILCFSGLLLGRKYGKKKYVKLFIRETSIAREQLYITLGVIGVTLFSADFIRLNGLFNSSKSSYSISIIGSIGALLIPILLVLGLYKFATDLHNKSKISKSAILMLILYTIPCLLNSGRESIFYVVIGLVAILGFEGYFKKRKSLRYVNVKSFLRNVVIILIVIAAFWVIVKISADRFGSNEISTYLNTHSVSAQTIEQASKWGSFSFLYWNFISYFGHQIPFLEFIIQEYKGPYMFGMYELNIISRRLPAFLGLDYNLVYSQLRSLYSSTGQSFSGAWQTFLGSFIIDFTIWVTPIVCTILGYFMGKVRKKFECTLDVRYAVLIAIMCLSMFSTIQLGPFYNVLLYGAFIWWIIIFRRDEGDIEN